MVHQQYRREHNRKQKRNIQHVRKYSKANNYNKKERTVTFFIIKKLFREKVPTKSEMTQSTKRQAMFSCLS